MTQKIVAIPTEKLGVLEHTFRQMMTYKLKKDRRSSAEHLNKMLKGLGLIEKTAATKALAIGVDLLGAPHAFVILEVDQHQGGEILEDFQKGGGT